MSLSSESGHKHFVIFVEEVKTTILGDESGDLLSIFLEENSDTLSDGRVRLFGFHSHLFDDESLGMRGSHERILISGSQKSLVVVLVIPLLDSSLVGQLSSCSKSSRFTHVLLLLKILIIYISLSSELYMIYRGQ